MIQWMEKEREQATKEKLSNSNIIPIIITSIQLDFSCPYVVPNTNMNNFASKYLPRLIASSLLSSSPFENCNNTSYYFLFSIFSTLRLSIQRHMPQSNGHKLQRQIAPTISAGMSAIWRWSPSSTWKYAAHCVPHACVAILWSWDHYKFS